MLRRGGAGSTFVRLSIGNLLSERKRFAATLATVAFCAFLVMFQSSLLVGFLRSASRIIRQVDADAFVVPRGVSSIELSAPLPDVTMHLVRGVPGVIEVRRLVTGFAVWRTARGSQQAVLVVGIEPSTLVAHASSIPLLGREQVAVDRSNTAMLEVGMDPVDIELNDRSARFSRRIDGFGSFMGTPYVFASHDDARRWLRLPHTTTNVLAVNIDPAIGETDVTRILAARLPEAEVYVAAEFARRAESFWLARTGAGGGILMAALLGLMVGAAVLSQTLYAVTLEHFQEYLTLRSLGATDWMIRRVVLLQAAICAGLGWVIATLVIAPLVGAATSVVPWIEFVWWVPGAALVAMVPIVLFASNVAIRAGLRADPAEVFRGQ